MTDRPERASEAREALARGKARLAERGNRLMLIAGLMICMFAAITALLLVSAVSVALDTESMYEALPVVDAVFSATMFLLAVLLVFPVVLGLYGTALSLRRGEAFDFSSLFFCFGSLRSYGRGLCVTLLILAGGAPFLVLFVLSLIATVLDADILYGVIGFSALPLIVLGLYTTSRCYPFLTLALNDPGESLLRTMRRALRLTSHRVWSVFVFRMRFFFAFLLSLLSIGVVTLFHTLPLTVFASCEYAMLLAEKRSPNAYESGKE